MTEQFTAITIEVLINNVWVNLKPDVLDEPAPHATRGMQSNGINDRVADAGEFTFSLKNGTSNSSGLVGRYSPGHANCLSGWTTSLPVRVGFSYDTWTIYKWQGRIEPDGIEVVPGLVGDAERMVNVTCVDYMGIAGRHTLNLLTSQANITMTAALQMLLDNMPVKPTQHEFNTDLVTFPLVFDITGTETTALGEFQKMATSAPSGVNPGSAYIYIKGGPISGELLYATNNGAVHNFIPTPSSVAGKVLRQDGTTDRLLLEGGGFMLREGGSRLGSDPPTGDEDPNFNTSDMQPGTKFAYGKHIANYVTIITYPRRVDAAATTVLWTLEAATAIAAGATITIRGAYNNPNGGAKINGTAFVTPVSGTDYKANATADGLGADLTSSLTPVANFGNSEVEFTLTNTGGSTLYVGGGTAGAFLQVRGKGVYIDDVARNVGSDAASMLTHGVKPLTIESKYFDLSTVFIGSSTSYSGIILNSWKDPQVSVENVALFANKDPKNMTHFLFIEPRQRVQITEAMNALSAAPYFVQGYDFTITAGKYVYWNTIYKRL